MGLIILILQLSIINQLFKNDFLNLYLNGAAALDEAFYLVDNNWYAYDWSRETFDHFTNYVLEQSDDRLMWGAGRVQGHVDLFDVIRSVMGKADHPAADYSLELTELRAHRDAQTVALGEQIAQELSALEQLIAI